MARGWRAAASAAKTPVLALLLLAAASATAEFAARSTFARSHFAAPSVGSPLRMLDLQLAKVDALARAEGGVDCVFVGNSLVLFGVDPDAFAAAFETRAGWRPRCFNFAVPGIAMSGMAALATIFAEDYRPRLMVYGVTARDFNEGDNTPPLEAAAWIRYRQGETSVDGWLADHSIAYRYYLHYANQDPAQDESLQRIATAGPRGFYSSSIATRFDEAATQRARELIARQMRYRTSDEELRALDRVLQLRNDGVQVVLVEIPLRLPPAQWPPDALASYRAVIDAAQRRAADAGVPFWPVPAELVPADGWLDLWHLNARGAEAFSRWLGERVATALANGEVKTPPRVAVR